MLNAPIVFGASGQQQIIEEGKEQEEEEKKDAVLVYRQDDITVEKLKNKQKNFINHQNSSAIDMVPGAGMDEKIFKKGKNIDDNLVQPMVFAGHDQNAPS